MSPDFPKRVTVLFREHASTVAYASDLAHKLRVPFCAFTPISADDTDKRASLSGTHAYRLRALMHQRMQNQLSTLQKDGTSERYTEIGNPFRYHSDIHVTCTPRSDYAHVPRLSPAGETALFRTTKGALFIPLGDGPSGLTGARYGVAMAKRLKSNVIFWHTTWRNPDVDSQDPRAHICDTAEKIILQAEQIAREACVESKVHIECAPNLVEGLVTTALESGASLIVMADGGHKVFGSYTERVRERNCPIPMLVVPNMHTEEDS